MHSQVDGSLQCQYCSLTVVCTLQFCKHGNTIQEHFQTWVRDDGFAINKLYLYLCGFYNELEFDLDYTDGIETRIWSSKINICSFFFLPQGSFFIFISFNSLYWRAGYWFNSTRALYALEVLYGIQIEEQFIDKSELIQASLFSQLSVEKWY